MVILVSIGNVVLLVLAAGGVIFYTMAGAYYASNRTWIKTTCTYVVAKIPARLRKPLENFLS